MIKIQKWTAAALAGLLVALQTVPALAEATKEPSSPTIEERLLKLEAAVKPPETEKQWFEKISLRGYVQIRYNRLMENNENLKCEQCDKGLGSNTSVTLRRARLIVSGDVLERVYVYIQSDLAQENTSTAQHYSQLRDCYTDVALDHAKESRFRVGLSKVPYGFENLQSSQNRLSPDRSDPLNSAVAGERDLGFFYYWAPEDIRKRFAGLVSSGLKGSGDYGVVGFGVFNGQTANRSEANDSLHTVGRITYPFRTENGQFIEASIQGYFGRFVVPATQRTNAKVGGDYEQHDRRAAASFIYYPQPIGFQAEYNFGVGPEYDNTSHSVESRHLQGGYVQTMYMIRKYGQIVTPFVRGQYYDGGKKQETDARHYIVRELEGGVEWQFNKALELTAAYSAEDRTYQDDASRNNRQKGGRMRLQLQFNF